MADDTTDKRRLICPLREGGTGVMQPCLGARCALWSAEVEACTLGLGAWARTKHLAQITGQVEALLQELLLFLHEDKPKPKPS